MLVKNENKNCTSLLIIIIDYLEYQLTGKREEFGIIGIFCFWFEVRVGGRGRGRGVLPLVLDSLVNGFHDDGEITGILQKPLLLPFELWTLLTSQDEPTQ